MYAVVSSNYVESMQYAIFLMRCIAMLPHFINITTFHELEKLNLINKQLNIHNNISVLDLVKKLSKYTVFI